MTERQARRASETTDAVQVSAAADGSRPADPASSLDLTRPADVAKLRADIESTRAELGATIEAFLWKINLPRRAKRKGAEWVASVRDAAGGTITRVKAARARSIARRSTRGEGDGGTA
jgi:hypothetical protein